MRGDAMRLSTRAHTHGYTFQGNCTSAAESRSGGAGAHLRKALDLASLAEVELP